MAKNSVLDQFDQFAVMSAAGTAALNGEVFGQLVTGLSSMQKVAWEIGRVEYFPPINWCSTARLNVIANYLFFGISQSATVTQTMLATNPALVDLVYVHGREQLTAVGVTSFNFLPIVHDFFDKPRLVVPQMIGLLIGWLTAANLSTENCYARIWYREREVTPEDWYDLLQLRMPLGSA